MSNEFAKKLLEKLQKKTNTTLDSKKLEALASKVNKKDIENTDSLLTLIRQLAVVANIELTKEKEQKVIDYLKKNNIQQGDMKTLLSLLNKKLD
jgi:phage antirepressor YoqD-like protein